MATVTHPNTVHTSHAGFTALDWIAWFLVIVGALNWGLIGAMRIDLVAALLGDMTMPTRIVYMLVGVAGLYCISIPFRRHSSA